MYAIRSYYGVVVAGNRAGMHRGLGSGIIPQAAGRTLTHQVTVETELGQIIGIVYTVIRHTLLPGRAAGHIIDMRRRLHVTDETVVTRAVLAVQGGVVRTRNNFV